MAPATYDQKREQSRQRQASLVSSGQDIGQLPPVKDPVRRQEAMESYAVFCEQYFPQSYTLPWSKYHRSAAEKIQRAVTSGGLFAFAMPRGSGKTTMCEWAVLWAVLSGRSPYCVLVGASEAAAERRLRNIKTQLSLNGLLLEDFPAECYPIRKLEHSARRAEGQKYKGRATLIEWKSKMVTLAWIPEELAAGSGARIDAFGLTGEIRGLNFTRPDGKIQRPTLAICDDPQTRESAKSPAQSHTRERTMAGDIAYLAGPGEPIACVVPCTVIYEGDLADQLLNRDKHPEFQGERSAMVEAFPDNMELCDKYQDIMQTELRSDGKLDKATKYYKRNRKKMDAGAEVSWPERHRADELSGIQHAMNLRIRDEAAFWAECQNQPMAEAADVEACSADEIQAKTSGFKRLEIPGNCGTLTCMIDVQGSLLYWLLAAWDPQFSGYVIDYGSWPEQGRAYYTLASARKTLKRAYAGDDEAVIYQGIQELLERIIGREYKRDDGATIRVARCMVDANWGGTSQLVNLALRQSQYAPVCTPSYGRGIKASHRPISQWQQSVGANAGPEWVPTKAKGNQLVGVVYDVNYWKKRTLDALKLAKGGRGSLSLFKEKPQTHRILADHIGSEIPKRVEHDGRTVYEWAHKPTQDNHLWDCLVGSMVAASLAGVSTHKEKEEPRQRRRRIRSH